MARGRRRSASSWPSNSVTSFDLIYVMTAGGPAGSTNTIATYIYVSAFKALDKGYASAIAYLLFIVILVVTAIQFVNVLVNGATTMALPSIQSAPNSAGPATPPMPVPIA